MRLILGNANDILFTRRRSVRRDAEHEKAWAEQGWNLIVVWECALKTAKERTFAFALRNLEKWAKGR